MNKGILERGLIGVFLLIALCQPVTAQQDVDTGLAELEISLTPMNGSVVLDPVFNSEVTTYTISFSDDAENLKLSLEASTSTASIEISYDGTVIGTERGNTVTTIPLSTVQVATIEIKVTVGQSSISYNFAANRVNLSQCIKSISDTDDDRYPGVLDIDKDGDGLIEICDLEGLNEIRFQLDGTGYTTSSMAMKVTTGCPSNGCKGYELTENLDFTDPSHYRNSANRAKWTANDARMNEGWDPIAALSSTLEGNNYTISNLYINRPGVFIALFNFNTQSSEIRNINLSDVNISGSFNVSGLIALNAGKISNSHITTGTVSGHTNVGGLAGTNGTGGRITDSSANGTITGNNVGGIAGTNLSEISNSFANGTIAGNKSVGGLVGLNQENGSIIDSYADSTVNGTASDNENIGGLIGLNAGLVTASYARGNVNVSDPSQGNDHSIGGLVGSNQSLIINSYATGKVQGHSNVGGLAGYNTISTVFNAFGRIANSYATGNVIGTGNNSQNIGGLVGKNEEIITNAYAEGNVSGVSNLGGLVGSLEGGTVEKSYTIATVSSTGNDNRNIRGLVGATSGTVTITASYWDNGVYLEGGTLSDDDGRGRTTAELQRPIAPGTTSTNVYYNWNTDSMGNPVYDWDFGSPQHYPALRYVAGLDEDVAACDSDPDTALPQCNLLLPNQRDRDRGLDFVFLLLEDQRTIFEKLDPRINSYTKEYDMTVISDTIQLRPFSVGGSSATIKITKDGETPERNYFAGMESGDTSQTIDLESPASTLIVTISETLNEVMVETVYRFTITKLAPLAISEIEVTPVNDDGTVNEGIEITLSPTVTGGGGNYRYRVQRNGEAVRSIIQDSSIKIVLPMVGTTTQNITFKLIVEEIFSGGSLITSQSKVLTVRLIENGFPDINSSVDTATGELSVSVVSGSDPDGDGTASYKWQELDYNDGTPRWIDTSPLGTGATYTVPANTPGSTRYRVEVSYSDGQGHETVDFIQYLYRARVDDDNDGLIEIYYLEDLDAIRYRPNRDGYSYDGVSVNTPGCELSNEGVCNGYELHRDLDFESDTSYSSTSNKIVWARSGSGEGWDPILVPDIDTLTFEGNNHTISNLYINRPGAFIALFYQISPSSEIRNINLSDVNVRGGWWVGGLIGLNVGKISNSHITTGTVSAINTNVGGLAGANGSTGSITGSSANGTITGNNSVGGLVGQNLGEISNSFANGTITGNEHVGGLVGVNTVRGSIIDSYADSTVNGTASDNENIGGLIGTNTGLVTASYARGNVNVSDPPRGNDRGIGGLVGYNRSLIINSYATGKVQGHRDVGGLVGDNGSFSTGNIKTFGRIANSYATGNVIGAGNNSQNIGGLVGNNEEIITNAYAEGNVSGVSNLGGLVGSLEGGTIEKSYTIATVSSTGNDNQKIGGLVGATSGTVTITASYWDNGVYSEGDPLPADDGRERTTTALQLPIAPGTTSTDVYYNWNTDSMGNLVYDWDFGSNKHYPILRYAADPNVVACADNPSTALPQCNLLLPNQRDRRDRGLNFIFLFVDEKESNLESLRPSFSSFVREYKKVVANDVNTIQVRPLAINGSSATITIIKDGETSEEDYYAGKSEGMRSNPISLDGDTTTLTIVVTDIVAGVNIDTRYILVINKLHIGIEGITIDPVIGDDTVEEGTDITLTVNAAGSDVSNYDFEWIQETDVPLQQLSGDMTASLSFRTSDDFIKGTATTANIVFKVTVRDRSVSVSTSTVKTLTINKKDNGPPVLKIAQRFISALDSEGSSEVLFLEIDEISDPDGTGRVDGEIEWEILRNGVWNSLDISSGNNPLEVTVVEISEVFGSGQTRFRATADYIDGQGYETEVKLESYRIAVDDNNNDLIDIYYLDDLDAIRRQLDGSSSDCGGLNGSKTCKGYELRSRLDFNADTSYISTSNKVIWTQGDGWEPIGDIENPFTGAFSASTGNLVIKNLFINRPATDYVGMFGVTDGAISGIHLEDANINGRFIVGGIAGLTNPSSRISDSSVSGMVKGSDARVGGLVGEHYGSINDSHAQGNVIGDTSVGGLAGYAFGPITNSYAHSDIRSQAYSGGLVGYSSTSTISNSYASGGVESIFYAGGLVGYNDNGTIANAYAIGDVVGSTHVGGLVGYTRAGSIANSYALGIISGADHIGGLVGSNIGSAITNSYPPEEIASNRGQSIWSSDNWVADDDNEPKLKYGVCGSEDTPMCGEQLPGQNTAGGKVYALSALTLSAGTLEPPFDPTKSEYEIIDIDDSIETIVTATARVATVSISLGSQEKVSMTTQASLTAQKIDLMNDNIVIQLTVSGESTKKYTIMLPGQPDLTGSPSVPCDVADEDRDDDGLIEICDLEGLYAIRSQLLSELPSPCDRNDDESCRGYELEKDLDFNDDGSYRDKEANKALWSQGKGWYPIGTYANPFNAEFNANDHSIANLRIDRPNSDYVGLFGSVGSSATIANIELVDAYVRGRFLVGALVGQNNGGRIIGSYTSNATTTSLVIGSGLRTGGLVGDHKGVIGDNSYASGIVSGNREVGGLVGYFRRINGDEAASDYGIVNSYARSAVRGRSFAGGLVGVNVNAIINSHATGAVESIFYTGGLVGLNRGSITDTYATGDVNGREIVGGLVGDNRDSINNSYARGTVTGHRSVGALVGNQSGRITRSFGIGHSELIGRQSGGTITNSRVVSSEQLQMPINEWEAEAWYFRDNNYPALRYISVAADMSCAADALCGTLLGGQYRELASLTVEEPAGAGLSKSAIFEYLLRIAEDVTKITLVPKTNTNNTTISYSIGNGAFNTATSGTPFTIDPLPATAQTITIKLEALDGNIDEGDLKDAEYTVSIERVPPTFIQLRLFLEGLLK